MSARRCCEFQDELALARLEGVALSEAAEDHFRDCPGCSVERLRLEEALGRLHDPIPDPGEEYWQSFLPRLRTRLAAESQSAPRRFFTVPGWALAATAASFFIAAIAAGGWKAPTDLDATARLHRLAVGTDAEGLQQALDLIAPDREPDFAGEARSGAVPPAAYLQDAFEEVFPEDDPGIYESSGELSAEEQRLARSLDGGWV